jgi:transcriptional regulator with XRE-family HTH domain
MKVRAARESMGLTQEQLHDLTGISRNQIQNIEHSRNNSRDSKSGRPGPGNARLDTIFLLAEALKVEVTYLIDPTQPIRDAR